MEIILNICIRAILYEITFSNFLIFVWDRLYAQESTQQEKTEHKNGPLTS